MAPPRAIVIVRSRPPRRLFHPVNLLLAYLLLQTALVGAMLAARQQLARFLDACPAIASPADLAAFKRVARCQMFGAIGILALGPIGIPGSLYLPFAYGRPGFAMALGLCSIGFALGRSTRSLEIRARALECGDHLRSEYERICASWTGKVLPDF